MDGQKTPFVFRFKTENKNYVYDVNSNRVFEVDRVLYELINKYGKIPLADLLKKYGDRYSKKDIEKAFIEINKAQKDGMFSTNRARKMAYGVKLKEALRKDKFEQLILNLTENCNMRCSYCIYSGKYKEQRVHSKRYMPEKTALKATEYFLNHCADEIYLGFYGGEPLLAFSLMKKIVEYSKSKTDSKIKFSLTTNATLLNEEIIRFFIKNKFSLTVSLDGPENVHDRYRKTIDGQGTFQRVMENLKKIKDYDADYYMHKVLFSVVNAPPLKLYTAAKFFEENDLVKDNSLSSTYVDYSQNSFLSSIQHENRVEEYDTAVFHKKYLEKSLNREPVPNFSKEFYDKNILQFYKRSKTKLDTIFPNGCCVPGKRRLFTDIDGKFHVCERMDYVYPVGDVDTGLDFNKLNDLVTEYISMSDSCLECWACRICSNCFASYINAGKLDARIRDTECAAVKEKLKNTLILYYSILEKDTSALDHLADAELI